MAESLKVTSSVGRTRRIAGFVLIVLGFLLWADAGWVGAFHGAWFGRDEWVRFGFLLWLGVMLTLAGCWLAYRSRRLVRRLLLGLIGALLVVAGYGFCWWWFVMEPEFDERRPFVGTWRRESPLPVSPVLPELVEDMELLFDGTVINRVWDPKTGAVRFNQRSPARWHVSNGRFQEIIHGIDWLHDLAGVGGQTWVCLDSPVTWETPDRFRVQRFQPISSRGASIKQVAMTWSRTESVTGLPQTHIPIAPK